MKTLLLFLLIFTLFFNGNSQDASYVWARQVAGPGAQTANDINRDPFGNLVTVGYFEGATDLNSGSGSNVANPAGGKDIFIHKMDDNGVYQWAVAIGGTGNDIAEAVATDNLGAVYVVGSFVGTVDFDPSSGTSIQSGIDQGTNAFVMKLDADGNFLWVRTYVSTAVSSTLAALVLDVDDNSNIIVQGSMYVGGNVDFDPGAGTSNLTTEHRIFHVKLTGDGTFLWVKGWTGYPSYEANPSGVRFDASSNIICSGSFQSIIDFDPGAGDYSLNGNGPSDAYVCKLDGNGNFLWHKNLYDVDGHVYATSMDTDNDGNIYVTGYFNNSMDFNPDFTTTNTLDNLSGSNHAYAMKLDSDGNYIYAKSLAASTSASFQNSSSGLDIESDADGNAYISGAYAGVCDLNSDEATVENLYSNGMEDMFVTKLNSLGGFVYSKRIGNTDTDKGMALILANTGGSMVIVGMFGQTIDVDPNTEITYLTSAGVMDAFMIKLAECAAQTSSMNITSCGNYTWNDQIYTVDGTYTQTFVSATGCDSIVTLNLDIASNSTSTFTASSCGQYIFNGQEFPESGNYNVVIENAAGCDSIISLSLTVTPLQDISVIVDGNTLNCDQGETQQWVSCTFNEYDIIPGATGPVYNPSASGSYAVQVTYGECVEYSECVDFTYIGLNEQTTTSMLSIMPNPAHGEIRIVGNTSLGNAQLTILSADGKSMDTIQMKDLTAKIDLSGYPAGVYFIRTNSNGVISHQRFIVD